MSEAALLALLLRYPDPVAISRRVSATTLHEGARRLEHAGLIVRRPKIYTVTVRGRTALEFNMRIQSIALRAVLAQ